MWKLCDKLFKRKFKKNKQTEEGTAEHKENQMTQSNQ